MSSQAFVSQDALRAAAWPSRRAGIEVEPARGVARGRTAGARVAVGGSGEATRSPSDGS